MRKLGHPNHFLLVATLVLFFSGVFALWVSSFRIPALEDISERRIDQSIKIYDRTGEILLYDTSRDTKRAFVPIEDISSYARLAALAIEDRNFYSHNGFQLRSFLRAILVNITTLSFSQGGSTITQQVVKNSILTKDKTPARKFKELILALKLEKVLTKDEILSLYLNEIPYGGTIYGIEEAAQSFFGKPARDLTLAESAYLAALPKAPTYYSPYGSHRDELESRKDLVLSEMFENGFISDEEFEIAMNEAPEFKPRQTTGGIKAPHFVFFVMEELVKMYGEETLSGSGFKVITTLNYDIQKEAEAVAQKYGVINKERFRAENNAMVAIDPKNGDIIAMVGSKDYFDQEIDGNFNAATGHRQPGSTFKPFVYSVLLNRGYTDETVFFDVPMQFSPSCPPDKFETDDVCYSPVNYDDNFRGPITMRSALAQSINIPAVQALYLAGVKDSVDLAKSLGIESLTDLDAYGLSLVLGGGAVSLLDITAAYSVFANDGERNKYNSILWVEDNDGNIVDRRTVYSTRVLPEQTARVISNILSDNEARSPSYGLNSPLYISSRDVAVKTGTSNDYRDAWIIGYTPNIAVGVWAGNNDNSEMEKKVAGFIVSPMWREFMDKILPTLPVEPFMRPEEENRDTLKPVLRGEAGEVGKEIHSILYWVDKKNPRGPVPENPSRDPQFNNWESAINFWLSQNRI